jgi:O-antigen ligase
MSEVGQIEPIRRPPKVVLGVSLFVLFLLPIVMLAGGGGVALLMFILACLGVLGLVAHKAYAKKPPLWLMALTAFLTWVWITQFWSPYPKVSGFSNAEKIWVMGMMFPAVIWLWSQMRDHVLGDVLRDGVIVSLLLGICLIFFETFSGFILSFAYDPPPIDEDAFWRKLDATRNVVRGTIFASALLMPIAALVWHRSMGKVMILLSAILISILALKVQNNIAFIAPWLGLCAGLLAMRFPNFCIKFVLLLSILSIFIAPAFASLIGLLDEDILALLPSSWEHRFYMWQFVFEQILQSPLIGHGFDSARTFTETVTLSRGMTMSTISLHPHNAGLHIWLETGLVGAILACFTIICLVRPALEFVAQSKVHAFGLCSFLFVMIVISSVSFGVWQFWWWGALSLGLACLNLIKIPE